MTNRYLEKIEELLHDALRIDRTSMGNIQVYQQETKTLHIISHKGFSSEFLEYFKVVNAFDSSPCGRAIGIGSIILINDVLQEPGFARHRTIAVASGFRAVRSIPVIDRNKTYLGVISSHFEDPKWTDEPKKLAPVIAELAKVLPQVRMVAC